MEPKGGGDASVAFNHPRYYRKSSLNHVTYVVVLSNIGISDLLSLQLLSIICYHMNNLLYSCTIRTYFLEEKQVS